MMKAILGFCQLCDTPMEYGGGEWIVCPHCDAPCKKPSCYRCTKAADRLKGEAA